MKKQILITTIALLAFAQVEAQVTFKPGLRVGLNLSHFTEGDIYNSYGYSSFDPTVTGNRTTDYNSKIDFYLGFYGALKLTKYYTLQPEIDYSRQGSKIDFRDNDGRLFSDQIDFSYLSLAVVNKFTFTDKFNVHIGPTIDIIVENNFPTDNDIDLAFILGAGYNFTPNFGLEARVKKGIVPAYYNYGNNYNDGDNHTNVVFSLGATYTFDIK